MEHPAAYPFKDIVIVISTVVGIVLALGTVAVRWILAQINNGDTRSQDAHAVLKTKVTEDNTALKSKIDDETKAIISQVNHKHNNVDAQFMGIQVFLDKLTDKIEGLTKDNVLLSERMRNQETQVREFKTEVKDFKLEMKESFRSLSISLDSHLKEFSATQNSQFGELSKSIRELRDVKQKP